MNKALSIKNAMYILFHIKCFYRPIISPNTSHCNLAITSHPDFSDHYFHYQPPLILARLCFQVCTLLEEQHLASYRYICNSSML